MKVIFVASGNKRVGNVSSFVQSQYDSLKASGLGMAMFPIKGKGALGYLKAVFALRKMVRKEKPDIIHAHYSTCGFVASLACLGLRHRPKIVVSILGSFPTRNAKWKRVRWAIQHLWDSTLTKSERTRNQLGLNLPVIPNGVNLKVFHPMNHEAARRAVGFESDTKYVVWCSNPSRPEKNYALAQEAIKRVNSEELIVNSGGVELVAVYDKTPEEVCTYMNAADCLLLTSDTEGSPNVIKEAMACNCPIVTTNVGDVTERLKDMNGCYVVEDNDCRYTDMPNAAVLTSEAIAKALEFGKRTDGNKRIIEDGLTIELTAKKIINWYESV